MLTKNVIFWCRSHAAARLKSLSKGKISILTKYSSHSYCPSLGDKNAQLSWGTLLESARVIDFLFIGFDDLEENAARALMCYGGEDVVWEVCDDRLASFWKDKNTKGTYTTIWDVYWHTFWVCWIPVVTTDQKHVFLGLVGNHIKSSSRMIWKWTMRRAIFWFFDEEGDSADDGEARREIPCTDQHANSTRCVIPNKI